MKRAVNKLLRSPLASSNSSNNNNYSGQKHRDEDHLTASGDGYSSASRSSSTGITIDDQLRDLYSCSTAGTSDTASASITTTTTTPSSYVPSKPSYEWIVDGKSHDLKDIQETYELWDELYSSVEDYSPIQDMNTTTTTRTTSSRANPTTSSVSLASSEVSHGDGSNSSSSSSSRNSCSTSTSFGDFQSASIQSSSTPPPPLQSQPQSIDPSTTRITTSKDNDDNPLRQFTPSFQESPLRQDDTDTEVASYYHSPKHKQQQQQHSTTQFQSMEKETSTVATTSHTTTNHYCCPTPTRPAYHIAHNTYHHHHSNINQDGDNEFSIAKDMDCYYLQDPVARMNVRQQQRPPPFFNNTTKATDINMDMIWDELLITLPTLFLTGDGDDDEKFLRQDRLLEWDEFVTDKLCALDAALEEHNRQYQQLLQPTPAQHINESICGTLHYHITSSMQDLSFLQDKIQRIRQHHSHNGQNLNNQWTHREHLRSLQHVAQELQSIYTQEEKLWKQVLLIAFVPNGPDDNEIVDQYQRSLQLRNKLLLRVKELQAIQALQETLERLLCLEDYFLHCIHDSLQSFYVGSLCTNDDSVVVNGLLESLMSVAVDAASRSRIGLSQQRDPAFLATDLTRTILNAFEYELNLAFCKALLMEEATPLNSSPSVYQSDVDLLRKSLHSNSCRDLTQLRTISHNLVTIRCDWESDQRLFPSIFWNMTRLLCDCLKAYHVLTLKLSSLMLVPISHSEGQGQTTVPGQEEKKEGSPIPPTEVAGVAESLVKHQATIWESALKVVEFSLREFADFSAKRQLFELQDNGTIDDSEWRKDLRDLQSLVAISHHFLSVGDLFVESTDGPSTESAEKICASIHSLLQDVCAKHIRKVHVNTINCMGRALVREDFVSQESNQTVPTAYAEVLRELGSVERMVFTVVDCSESTSSFSCLKNPMQSPRLEDFSLGLSTQTEAAWSTRLEHMHMFASTSWVGDSTRVKMSFLPCLDSLFWWVARLVFVGEMLPVTCESGQLDNALIDAFDLYALTVFRLCTGDQEAESMLVSQSEGAEKENAAEKGARSERTGKKRQSVSNARIASFPLSSQSRDAAAFLARAKSRLDQSVRLDKVNTWLRDDDSSMSPDPKYIQNFMKRVVSSISIRTVVELAVLISTSMPHLSLFLGHCEELVRHSPTLLELASRVSCVRALGGEDFVLQIFARSSVWIEQVLHEHSNDYVEAICLRFNLITTCLEREHFMNLEYAWQLLTRACCEVLVEGFSRVKQCSTEGRALMMLDCATLRATLCSGAPIRRDIVKACLFHFSWVESYIKVYYLEKHDVLKWVLEHYQEYKLSHCLSLFDEASPEDEKDIAFVMALYE